MLEEAEKKLKDLAYEARVVPLLMGLGDAWGEVPGDGHALPFPDCSFDTVIGNTGTVGRPGLAPGSLCLCAMEHPGKAADIWSC